MKKGLLIALLACTFASARSQGLKMKGDSLATAYHYLFKTDSIPAWELPRIASSGDQWKGRKLDSVGQFDLYQLPADRMICLVPNRNNPAKANTRNTELHRGPGQIPNPLQQRQARPLR